MLTQAQESSVWRDTLRGSNIKPGLCSLEKNSETVRGLVYPYGSKADPVPGEPIEVAAGVFWVRFAMPGSLSHINLWLLEDGDGWTIIDTCMNIPSAREQWQQLFDGFMQGKPVKRVVCTHLHPDHVGLAGWICEHFDCELWMAREEFLMCRSLAGDTGRETPDVAIRFYRAAGFDDEQLDAYRARFGRFGLAISPIPDSYRRLQAGDTIRIDDRYWQLVVGSGHSPEHMALYCPALKLLISGDQVLPRITPNVSVFPTEPRGDTLKDWLQSSARIRASLPDDVLVLPAHEAPFYGLHVRLTQIIESHERDLDSLYAHLAQPRRAVDCFPALFKREITEHSIQLATGETLAHLNCLIGRRMVQRERDASGVDWYVQKADIFEDEEWS
jgi:glyoxylase-like metal-dependent hydrolase (beta-lactamase superfamily II)